MNGDAPPRVTVIGGGIVGICSALSLAEQGVAVRLIDRDEPGQGASMGNAGVISPFSVVPQSLPGLWKRIPGWLLDPLGPVALRPGHFPHFLPWALRFLARGRESEVRRISGAMERLNHGNVELYRRHLAGTGHEGLIRDSSYVLACRGGDKARLDTLENELRRACGAAPAWIDGPELRRIEPALAPDFSCAIVVPGQARALSPGRVGAVLTGKLRDMGVEILRAQVRGIRREGDTWHVTTSGDTLTAPRLILATGAWSGRLLRPLGLRVPLEAERGYHAVFTDPGVNLNNSVMDMDRKFVASSMETGLRAAGTAEFSGLDAPPDQRRLDALIRNARRLCPELNADGIETWSGVRPSLPDSLPVIGEIPGQPGLIAAFGHGHWGFMMGPRTGLIAADLAQGRRPNIDLAPYAADRF